MTLEKYRVQLDKFGTSEKAEVVVVAENALMAMTYAEVLVGEDYVAINSEVDTEKPLPPGTIQLAVSFKAPQVDPPKLVQREKNESFLIDEYLWLEYNKDLKGELPVWDFSDKVIVLHLDFPEKNDFWMNEDGDERYTVTILLACKSRSEEEYRYVLELIGAFKSYEDVLNLKEYLSLGYHLMKIDGWDERPERFLTLDRRDITGGTHDFLYLTIKRGYIL